MRPTSGQTGLLITLFILVLGLTGGIIYLYIQQGSVTKALTQKIEDQAKALRNTKETIEELTQKIKTQNEAISENDKNISNLKDDSKAVRTSLADVQSSVKEGIAALEKDLAAFKKDSNQRLEPFVAASAKMESKLNAIDEQVKKLKGLLPSSEAAPVVTPVIDVKVEPSAPAPVPAPAQPQAPAATPEPTPAQPPTKQ